ncbi:shieldin complex subunit 3 [Hippoglossus stenolepis]|uniref:shieldin complex subunit 3 n=1 Tax=Hippoglossus stenolepis TaxID=195615 RepID=UPI001FAFBDD0|nr:shieldin complex subunit 3 [Hippoglossus stenolepis]XP_035021257.2 shieldin complex subunit 3 [Hippoglossus stenolepis]
MEDVVLHYHSGSVEELRSLFQRTEKLLECFPCRPPPLFRPWFPSDHRPPIRPAKPAPVITCAGDSLVCDSRPHTTGNQPQKTRCTGFFSKKRHNHPTSETTGSPPEKSQRGNGVLCISETPNHLPPSSLCPKPERGVTGLSPQKLPLEDKHGVPVTDAAAKRSWSVFTRRGVFPQSCHSLSKQFDHMVSVHRLHLRQRAKWVIRGNNCGSARDVEQVWRTLSRCVRSGELPTCNANIQRDLAEIWVFCDVLCSEQVGRFLKDELQLSGRIVLSVHQRGNVFSL